jgi:AraC-like DNA-binding protein
VLDEMVLDGLRTQLMAPELLREFIAAFTDEWNRLTVQRSHGRAVMEAELASATRKLRGLIDALADGFRSPGLQLDELEERKQRLRAERVAAMLRADPADRRPLAALAAVAGASHRTIERLFASETGMSFGRWRVRHRMIAALEQLANGDSVSNVADAVGYETPSSFIAAFRDSFGTTPTAYFQGVHDRRATRE